MSSSFQPSQNVPGNNRAGLDFGTSFCSKHTLVGMTSTTHSSRGVAEQGKAAALSLESLCNCSSVENQICASFYPPPCIPPHLAAASIQSSHLALSLSPYFSHTMKTLYFRTYANTTTLGPRRSHPQDDQACR